MPPQGRKMELSRRCSRRDRLRCQSYPRDLDDMDLPSHRPLPLLTTNTPWSWDKLVSQTPPASYPTQLPPRLARGEAHTRHSDALGPVHVVQAGEQLIVGSAFRMSRRVR